MHRYFLLHKPYGYLSQFTREVPEHLTLADLGDFPPDVYPVGRLDKDSEGLLILTNDKQFNHRLLNPDFEHPRTYWAQVDGAPGTAAIEQLRSGVAIKVNKKVHQTLPAKVQVLDPPPNVEERDPPIRYRANIPTTWLELTLIEGKNRQVRRMCAKVGFPVLRLLRVAIGNLELGDLARGAVMELEKEEMYRKLGL